MAINLDALKKAEKSLQDRNSTGAFISTKNINADTGLILRLLPPPIELNGRFDLEVTKFWMNVNGKRAAVICSSTFGKKSVIEEEIAKARNEGNEDVQEVLDDVAQTTCIKKDFESWAAVLEIAGYVMDEEGNVKGVTVVDNMPKIFQNGKQTLQLKIIKLATSGKAIRAAKGSENGIADRKFGTNIICTKTGEQKLTRYDAQLDEQVAIPAAYVQNVPNVFEICQMQTKSMAYQRAAIRNHIYGEEIPAEIIKKEEERAAKAKEALTKIFKPVMGGSGKTSEPADEDAPAPKKAKKPVVEEDEDVPAPKKSAKAKAPIEDDEDEDVPAKPVAKKKAAVVEDDDDLEEDEAPAPKKSAKAKAPSLLDDEDEDEKPAPKKSAAKKPSFLDDEDEDEAPAPKKSAKAKAPVEDEDEDDDIPAPVIKKNKVPPPPVASKKAAHAKKSMLDDVDDIDDDSDE